VFTIASIFLPINFDTNYYLMVQKLESDCLELRSGFDISTFSLKRVMTWKLNNIIRLNSQSRFLIGKREILTGLLKVLDSA